MNFDNLHRLIDDMDLPLQKKTATEQHDLRWLSRNMFIRNSGHSNFEAASIELNNLLK